MPITGVLAATSLAGPLFLQKLEVDLTPPERLPLGGYTARDDKLSEPGGERLVARVFVLNSGKVKVALVVCDLLTMPDSLYREVEKRLPSDLQLFLAATHTHSAPDSQMLNDRMTFKIPGIASFQRRWLDWYADRIAAGVQIASSLKPKELKSIEDVEFEAPLNRGRRPSARPDATVTVLEADRVPMLFEYAAHPVFYGPERMQTSEDWPGAVSRSLGCVSLVGAIGDVSPHAEGATPEQEIVHFATRMVLGFRANRDHAKPLWSAGKPFDFVREPVELGTVHAHPTMGRAYKVPQVMAEAIVSKFAPTSSSITAIRLGKLAIIGVPGEPTSHLGRTIKAYGLEQGFTSVLVISHVNGWMGYILDRADYDQGGYEATLSFYGREEGEKVVLAAEKAIRRLARE